MHNTSIQLLLYVSFILTGERYIPQDAVDDVVEADTSMPRTQRWDEEWAQYYLREVSSDVNGSKEY